jgi:hypothetical protein
MAPVALTGPAREALRVLACCPGVPTDVFAQLIGAGHPVSAYQLLARLRDRGLATSKQAVLGPLLGSRICNLWSLTQHGHAIVLAEGVASVDRGVCNAGRERKRKAATVEVVASYRALAGLVAHEVVSGGAVRVLCWASPWMRSFQKPNTARISHVRLSGAQPWSFAGQLRRDAFQSCLLPISGRLQSLGTCL